MLIGSWGPDLVFEVTGTVAKTFSELTQESSGRWHEHNIINSAPISEFLGPGLDTIAIEIIFSTLLGVEPRESYDALRARIRRGARFPLILGGIPLSDNSWYCREIVAESSRFAPRTGEVMWMSLTIRMKEYN